MAKVRYDIPYDIIYEILSWLPVKSLLRFKVVCKEWYDLIHSFEFVEYHQTRSIHTNNNCSLIVEDDVSSINHVDDLETFSHTILKLPRVFDQVVGTYKGLVYLRSKEVLALCNPALREIRYVNVLPEMKLLYECGYAISGFGYDRISDDYKIVVVSLSMEQTWVYSLKSDSWKNLGLMMPGYFIPITSHWGGVFNNNRLHWLDSHYNNIVYFDLHDEAWGEVPMMTNRESLEVVWMHLGSLDGCLCLSYSTKDRPIDNFAETRVWVMKEYGVKESWTPLFYFNNVEVYPITYCNDRTEIIFRESYHRSMFRYKLDSDHMEYIHDFPVYKYQSTIESYVDGLISLPGSQALEGEIKHEEIEQQPNDLTYHIININ